MKKNSYSLFLVGLTIALSTSPLYAQDTSGEHVKLSYSYVEAAYLRREGGLNSQLVDNGLPSDVLAGDGNGFLVRASIEVEDGVYFFGAFEREKSDYDLAASIGTDLLLGDFDVTYQSGRIGIGYFNHLGKNLDLYYQFGVTYSEFRAGSGVATQVSDGTTIPIDLSDESQNGISGNFEIGLRKNIADKIEVDGSLFWNGAQRVEREDADSLKLADDFGGKIAARFNLNSVFSVGAEYQRSKLDRFLVVVRARF